MCIPQTPSRSSRLPTLPPVTPRRVVDDTEYCVTTAADAENAAMADTAQSPPGGAQANNEDACPEDSVSQVGTNRDNDDGLGCFEYSINSKPADIQGQINIFLDYIIMALGDRRVLTGLINLHDPDDPNGTFTQTRMSLLTTRYAELCSMDVFMDMLYDKRVPYGWLPMQTGNAIIQLQEAERRLHEANARNQALKQQNARLSGENKVHQQTAANFHEVHTVIKTV